MYHCVSIGPGPGPAARVLLPRARMLPHTKACKALQWQHWLLGAARTGILFGGELLGDGGRSKQHLFTSPPGKGSRSGQSHLAPQTAAAALRQKQAGPPTPRTAAAAPRPVLTPQPAPRPCSRAPSGRSTRAGQVCVYMCVCVRVCVCVCICVCAYECALMRVCEASACLGAGAQAHDCYYCTAACVQAMPVSLPGGGMHGLLASGRQRPHNKRR